MGPNDRPDGGLLRHAEPPNCAGTGCLLAGQGRGEDGVIEFDRRASPHPLPRGGASLFAPVRVPRADAPGHVATLILTALAEQLARCRRKDAKASFSS